MVIVGGLSLLLALMTLLVQWRTVSGRLPARSGDVHQEMTRWVSSPFSRWSAIFLSASCFIGAWFARDQSVAALLVLLSGVVFASSAILGWHTRGRLDEEGAAKASASGDFPARRWMSAVPLGVTGMFFVLASRIIRGAAGDHPGTTALVALTVAMIVGVLLLITAGIAAAKAATDKAQRDYLDKR